MSPEEFHRKACEYITYDVADAQAMADDCNAVGVDGEEIVVVRFGDMWSVMTKRARDVLPDQPGVAP